MNFLSNPTQHTVNSLILSYLIHFFNLIIDGHVDAIYINPSEITAAAKAVSEFTKDTEAYNTFVYISN